MDRVLQRDRGGLDIGCRAAHSNYGEWVVTVGHCCGQPGGTRRLGASALSHSTRDVSLHRHGRRARGAYGETLADTKRG